MDRQAIEEYGIPSLDLMEHAAQAVAGAVRDLLKGYKNPLIGGTASVVLMGLSGDETETEAQREERQRDYRQEIPSLDTEYGRIIRRRPGNARKDNQKLRHSTKEKIRCKNSGFFKCN